MKPRSLLVLAALLALSFTGSRTFAAGADPATNWAGLVLVRPNQIVDESGTGSPPLPAGQDGDGYADTDETVDLSVLVSNKSGQNLTNVVVRLSSTDVKVDCISSSVAVIGSLPAGATVSPAAPFRFRVSPDADRGGTVPPVACSAGRCSNGAGSCTTAGQCARGVLDAYAARFIATVTADQLPQAGEDDSFDVELDLNSATAVKATSTFVEGFESGALGLVPMPLDANIATNTLSDGKRCQYNDPDFAASNSYGDSNCYLGFAGGAEPLNWHIHDTADTDGGRAFLGARSLHFGVHTPGQPGMDTYTMSKIEAIRTKSALQLAARVCRDDPATDKRACNSAVDCVVVGGGPCIAASPELSFAQQVSLVDDRIFALVNETMDRAVVYAKTTTGTVWRKLYPFENVYDRKHTPDRAVCAFDPDDDGNNEDDYFQPGDPARRFGPSSTCAPEFAYAYIGNTDQPFAAGNVGNAVDGPGLQGSLGTGTWVRSRFDLSAFRGRSITIRWLVTSFKVSDIRTLQDLFHFNPSPLDDGWYVDDVRVTQTLGTSAPTASQDSADRSFLPGCAGACTTVNADLVATPSPSPAPGYPVTLSAASSAADACPGGQLSYEYWVDGDANANLGDAQDWAFAGPGFSAATQPQPRSSTTFGVRVRCASSPSCLDDATLPIVVECPSPQTYSASAWWASLRFAAGYESTITFNDSGAVGDYVRGRISTLRSTGSFADATCQDNDIPLTPALRLATLVGDDLPVGDGYYYLARGTEPTCAEPATYRTFHPKENPGNPSKRDDEITSCPAP